jgi:hypothetical protein
MQFLVQSIRNPECGELFVIFCYMTRKHELRLLLGLKNRYVPVIKMQKLDALENIKWWLTLVWSLNGNQSGPCIDITAILRTSLKRTTVLFILNLWCNYDPCSDASKVIICAYCHPWACRRTHVSYVWHWVVCVGVMFELNFVSRVLV